MALRLRSLLASLLYVLFLVIFVEVALQAFYYFTAGGFLFARVGRPIYVPNEYSGFWNKPNLTMEHNTNEFRTMLYTNSEGFRVSDAREEYAIPKDPHKRRIMLLGPSFAFGWGVNYEDTFATHLEALLEAKASDGRDVEIINAGVPSLGPISQLRWFQHRGVDFQPDLVIQFIYGSMAVGPDSQENYTVNDDGYLISSSMGPGRRLQHALKQSAMIFYGWVLYTRIRTLIGGANTEDGVQGAGRVLEEQTEFDVTKPAVRAALEFYDDLRAAVDRIGADLVVVYFPLSYAIHPEDASRWRHLGVKNMAAQERFDEEFCRHLDEERSIRCINITDDLERAARSRGERLYYWLDIHWTPAGNAVAAEAVARALSPGP